MQEWLQIGKYTLFVRCSNSYANMIELSGDICGCILTLFGDFFREYLSAKCPIRRETLDDSTSWTIE